MPDLNAIDDFKLLVNSLGQEPAIIAREGGSIEDVPVVSPDSHTADTSEEFDLDNRLSEAVSEGEIDEFVPDLGGFDFGEDEENPFGDLGDFTLDDEDDLFSGAEEDSGFEFETDTAPDNLPPEAEPEISDSGIETSDEISGFTEEEFADELPIETLEEIPDEIEPDVFADLPGDEIESAEEEFPIEEIEPAEEEFPEVEGFSFSDIDDELEAGGELPETMGDLFEDGSEEIIPDFVATEQEEEELSFDDFTLDIPAQESESSIDLDEAEDLLPLEELSEETAPTEETIEEFDSFDDFDLADESEISLGDDFDSEVEVEEIGELEPEMDFDLGGEALDDFDLSPGDFGESTDVEDYSFGEELDAIDEMKKEVPADTEFEITEDQFEALKRTLFSLPRNLKLAVEEIIAEQKIKGEKYEKFIMLLVKGAAPKEIAEYLLKTLNRKIKLPSGYMKKSGLAMEKRKSGFVYIFTHHTWPILRWVLLGITALWLISLLSLLFLYRPIYAGQLYSEGYESVYSDQYDSANAMFEKAWNGWNLGPFFIEGWRNKSWFYKYADAYRDRRQFIEAARKYDELLTFYPDDIRGMMDYAHMETYDTARYGHAEEILREVLGVKVNDYNAMLAFGDNYFEWSDEDPSKLEDARFVYATILDERGGESEILLRMLRYFLKRKDDKNILRLKDTFQKSKNKSVDPEYYSKVYSELGGYLLDNGEPAEALSILLRAEAEYDEIPDVHFQLARYFRINEDDKMEELALRKVLFYLDRYTPLKKDKIFMKLDTHRRRGELKYRKNQYLDAENEYRQGIALYENSIIRNLIGASATGGKLYADLGELYYGNQDYMAALNMYDKAEDNRYLTPEIEYHRGYSTYITGHYERAILEFYNAEQGLPGNKNILFALGNTMLKRENYYGAQSAYTRVINQLEEEEKNIGFLQIDEKDEHRALIEMYSRAYRNLGVAYYRLARSSTDIEKISLAMVCLTRSSDYDDLLTRERDTKIREDVPETFETPEAYESRESGNILDRSGADVDVDYEIPRNVDDILF